MVSSRRGLELPVTAFLLCLAPPNVTLADRIVPAPGEADHDAALDERADGWVRVQHAVLSPPLGFGLEAFVSDPTARATIDAFVASGDRDFETSTGMHPYALLDFYEEHGDLGMFGGVQAAGEAFRYVVLRDGGAPAEDARLALLAAMDGLHWQTAVTGEPGVVARGIRRITPEPGEPPLPGATPDTLALFDAEGNPQPADKDPTWRDDFSGELPFLIWLDDCSKDQLAGYVFALGAVYDAVVDDDSIERAVVDRLVEDARQVGIALTRQVNVGGEAVADLVIVDADGRPTSFHDLSAEELGPGAVFPRPINGVNGLMALGIMRTLFHITGDEAIGAFYYGELVDPVPAHLRPPSNFVHRSDPHAVNGGGGDRLNPAGSMHAAYWLGRILEASSELDANISPHARAALPWSPPTRSDAGPPGADAGAGPAESAGCGCRAAGTSARHPWAAAALGLLLPLLSRRRRVSRGGRPS